MTDFLLALATIIFLAAGLLAWHHFFGTKREREFEKNKNRREWRPQQQKKPAPAYQPPPKKNVSSLTMPSSAYVGSDFFVDAIGTDESHYGTPTTMVRVKEPNLDWVNKTINDLLASVNNNVDRQMRSVDQIIADIDKKIDRINKTNSTGGR